MAAYRARWEAFGWHAVVVDGHDVGAIAATLEEARGTTGRPTMILARTVKGKGVSLIEGKDGWHGKPIEPGADLDAALDELHGRLGPATAIPAIPPPVRSAAAPAPVPAGPPRLPSPAGLRAGEPGGDTDGLRRRAGPRSGRRIPASWRWMPTSATPPFSQTFEERASRPFFRDLHRRAGDGRRGHGAGQPRRHPVSVDVPPPSWTRASDFVRMAGIGGMNIKLAGSHAGVSIGEDGPSQMALEDLAMMRAVPGCARPLPVRRDQRAARLVEAAAGCDGMVYIRTSRPKTPVIYGPDDEFPIGGSKVLRESPADAATVVAAGVTVFEALRAHDLLAAEGISLRVVDAYSVQTRRPGHAGRRRAPDGGAAHHRRGSLRRRRARRRGQRGGGRGRNRGRAPGRARGPAQRAGPTMLLERFGISASCIAAAVRRQVGAGAGTAAASRA